MQIEILTLFPEMFQGPLNESLLKKAREKGLFSLNIINIRDFSEDKHKTADDSPYGGGPGMVMKFDVVASAITSVKKKVEHRTPLDFPRFNSGQVSRGKQNSEHRRKSEKTRLNW